MNIFKNTKVIIFFVVLLLGFIILGLKGLQYGLDFSGGTQFILTLSEPIEDSSVMEKVQTTISQRMDWTGLKDVKVSAWDNQFISVQVAESDPKSVAQIEELLQKQGKFECIFENKVLFTGDDVVSVSKDPQKGYGIHKIEGSYQWVVPFTLSAKAARSFSEGIFHKCISLPDGSASCPSTFFFIDRPTDSLVLIPKEVYEAEKYTGNNTKIEDILKNSNINYLVVDKLDANTVSLIQSKLETLKLSKVVYSADYDVTLLEDANLNITLKEVRQNVNLPWTWSAVGLKTIIGLREDITNKNAATVESSNFNTFMNLAIEGGATEITDAQKEVNELSAILSSGSLPVGIENISKETVSPVMGDNILSKILIMGLLAILVVAIVIFIRYGNWRIALPIFVVGASEIALTVSVASLINWQLDLASIAGILTAVGTGINDQIIITDELEKNKGKDQQEERSLLSRIKRAFFIIWMAAATMTVTMLPIIFVFGGVPKLVGFALTTLIGVAIGVFITRPAFAAIIKEIING